MKPITRLYAPSICITAFPAFQQKLQPTLLISSSFPAFQFEWDENKREANIAKHGPDLMTGGCLFDGRPVYSYPSPRGEENRYVTVGLLAEELVAVVWTDRDTGIRLPIEEGERCGKKNLSCTVRRLTSTSG